MNINRLFVFSFKNGNDNPTKNSFDKNFMPLVEIKYFNAFFDQPVKTNNKHTKNLLKYDDYATGNLLDFSYHQNYYKLIGIDASRQANRSIPQQINFTGELDNDCATMFFIAEKQQKRYSKLFFRFIHCNRI